VVHAAIEILDHEIQIRKAAIQIEGPLPPVVAHGPTLERVLIHLISNALKYVAPQIKPEIRIWAEQRGSKVRLWIADNGIGIAQEHHERIFRVFERLHGPDTYAGTGIGLAIVRKGVERMGGVSGIESAIGQGSRFWIELKGLAGSVYKM
jgi:signal transduction histidine kinase